MIQLSDIMAARRNISGLTVKTPLQYSFLLSKMTGCDIYLKLENVQRTGAFKVRGAVNKMTTLSPEERAKGVVAVSSGNFALGVAYAARALGGIPATLFMPVNTPASKVEKLSVFDVELVLKGADFEEAYDISREFQQERGLTFVHSYDDPLVVAGQGTVGLEIMEDLPEVEAVLVPIGGGGLIAGIAVAVKAINPQARVIGVQLESSPSAYLSLKEGHCYERYKAGPTIAEGLAGGFGIVPFTIARDLIDEVVLVDDDEIYEAIFVLLDKAHLVVEGSGAVGVAALLSGKIDLRGKKVAVVLSGGNIDTEVLSQAVSRGMGEGENAQI